MSLLSSICFSSLLILLGLACMVVAYHRTWWVYLFLPFIPSPLIFAVLYWRDARRHYHAAA